MRNWLNDARSYIEPVKINEVMRALGIGHVIDSKDPKFKAGDLVRGSVLPPPPPLSSHPLPRDKRVHCHEPLRESRLLVAVARGQKALSSRYTAHSDGRRITKDRQRTFVTESKSESGDCLL